MFVRDIKRERERERDRARERERERGERGKERETNGQIERGLFFVPYRSV